MTSAAELAAWNEEHPTGTHMRWVGDDTTSVHSGRTSGPARMIAGTSTAVVKIDNYAELIDIDRLDVVPPIETINDFMVSSNGQRFSVLRNPIAMNTEQALRLAAWLVMIAALGETDRFEAILTAIKET